MGALTFITTPEGRAALRNAKGDGTNAVRIAYGAVTAKAFAPGKVLPDQIKRIAAVSGNATAADTIHVTISDESADVYTVRGFGIYLTDDTLFASFGQADVIMEKAAGAAMQIQFDAKLADLDGVKIEFPQASFSNPAATIDTLGVVKLASEQDAIDGTDTQRSVTPRALLAALNGRLGKGAPSDFGKTVLAMATAAALKLSLGIKGAAGFDPGDGKGLDADLLDGQHGDYYLKWANLTGIPEAVKNLASLLDTKRDKSDGVFSTNIQLPAGGGLAIGPADTVFLYDVDNKGTLGIRTGTKAGYSWFSFDANGDFRVNGGAIYAARTYITEAYRTDRGDNGWALIANTSDGKTTRGGVYVEKDGISLVNAKSSAALKITDTQLLTFRDQVVWTASNFDPATKANTKAPTFTDVAYFQPNNGTTAKFRIFPYGDAGITLDAIIPDGSASAPLNLGASALTLNGKKVWHEGNFDPSSKAPTKDPTFDGTLTAPNIVSKNGSLRASGWGKVDTDGVIYFGGAGSYIFKNGASFVFNNEQGGYSTYLNAGGVIWTSNNITPLDTNNGGTINGMVKFSNNTAFEILGTGANGTAWIHGAGGAGDNVWSIQRVNTSSYNVALFGNHTVYGSTVSSGGFQVSDKRLKTKIRPLAARPLHRSIKRRAWEWIQSGVAGQGVIAQHVLAYAPEHVTTYTTERKKSRYAVDTAGLALEQSQWCGIEIDRLAESIDALQTTIKALRKRVHHLEKTQS
ncbi:tail fiber domain-containing protein [Dyella sp. ASV21]|uniref:tail fiber domain-containing protein n=1 Tax=Dyella sp. ASV21 TaxID=2795114 RepID=UPI0018EC26CF|nr:tail fiber domain-containing protein [Dyella sp. ASV21]